MTRISITWKNRSHYPEVAELINDKKNPSKVYPDGLFKVLFEEKWIDRDSNDFGFSEFRDCPYRQKAFGSIPSGDLERIRELYDCAFKELFIALDGKEE